MLRSFASARVAHKMKHWQNLPLLVLVVVASQLAVRGSETATPSGCEVYLCKYGYMIRQNCSCSIPPLRYDMGASFQWWNSDAHRQNCSASHFKAALIVFQTTFGVIATGECDQLTKDAMSRSRCGVADDFELKAALSLCSPEQINQRGGETYNQESSTYDGGAKSLLEARKGPVEVKTLSRHPRHMGGNDRLMRMLPVSHAVLEAAGRPLRSGQGTQVVAKQTFSLKNVFLPAKRAERSLLTSLFKFEIEEERISRQWKEVLEKYEKRPVPKSDEGQYSGSRKKCKRSTSLSNGSIAFSRTSLKWRILPGFYNPVLSSAAQEAAMDLAFRKWAAITPLCFAQDVTSDVSTIDIQIAFASGAHLGDNRPFDGPGGELAHSFTGAFTHFDNSESWYAGMLSQTGVSIIATALHEFGHVIGLSHSASASDVMHSMYSGITTLSAGDRSAATSIYGRCSGSFNAIADLVYSVTSLSADGSYIVSQRYFSTIFFRSSLNWLYLNSAKMPLDGEPQTISSTWAGIPNSVDAVVQYSKITSDKIYVDIIFVFKGSDVYILDYAYNVVTSTAAISSVFLSGSMGQSIPNNLDSAYFDPRDGNIYFFKGSLVYVYNYVTSGEHSCCVLIDSIAQVFPLASTQASAFVRGMTYQQNVDAVYQSLSSNSLYFFVGNNVWVNENFTASSSVVDNSMTYFGPWNKHWKYICEVTC